MAKIKIPGNQDVKLRETPLFKTAQFTDGKFLKTAVEEAIIKGRYKGRNDPSQRGSNNRIDL